MEERGLRYKSLPREKGEGVGSLSFVGWGTILGEKKEAKELRNGRAVLAVEWLHRSLKDRSSEGGALGRKAEM